MMISERLHSSRQCPCPQHCQHGSQESESYYLLQLRPEWSQHGKVFQVKKEQRHFKRLATVLTISVLVTGAKEYTLEQDPCI